MYPQGGGFGIKVPKEDFVLHFEPAPEPAWKKSYFTCDGMSVVLPGYTNGLRWNGWQVPYFERAAIDILMAETNHPEFVIHYWKAEEPNVLVFEDMQEKLAGAQPEDYRAQYTATEIEVDGVKVIAYTFGDGWCWDECDDNDLVHTPANQVP